MKKRLGGKRERGTYAPPPSRSCSCCGEVPEESSESEPAANGCATIGSGDPSSCSAAAAAPPPAAPLPPALLEPIHRLTSSGSAWTARIAWAA